MKRNFLRKGRAFPVGYVLDILIVAVCVVFIVVEPTGD